MSDYVWEYNPHKNMSCLKSHTIQNCVDYWLVDEHLQFQFLGVAKVFVGALVRIEELESAIRRHEEKATAQRNYGNVKKYEKELWSHVNDK